MLSDIGDKFGRFIRESRRRKTIRTAVIYLGIYAGIVGTASDSLPAVDAPEWILPAIIYVLLAGFFVVLAFSWKYDFTFHGFERTLDLEEDPDDDVGEIQQIPEQLHDESKPAVSIPMGSAHRRQVTLLRCTFAPLSNGASVADPETMLSMLPDLDQIIDRTARRFSAAKLSSSAASYELLFGYPIAFENDAVRAVAAGLSIVDDTGALGSADQQRVAATVAIHSDLVVIEEPRADGQPVAVVGAAAQIAGWLQTLSPPDTVALDDATAKLLRDRFHCETLGEHTNAQLGISTTVYRALELSAPGADLEVHADSGSPVLGRESELALMMDRWDRAMEGEDQFLVLRGEPGIGKSTLVREVAKRARQSGSMLVMPMYCSPFEINTAFHPIIEYLMGPGLGLRKDDSDADRSARISHLLAESGLDVDRAAPLMAALLSFGEGRGDESDSNEAARAEMLKCLLEIFKASAKRGPVLLIFEDLHWSDPSTLEVIDMLVSQGTGAGVLCIFTTRPTFKLEWESRSNVTTLDLQALSRRMTESLVANILGDTALPAEYVSRIVAETGGNPLFAEELTKAIAESAGQGSGSASAELILPGTLQQSLASRIDNLGSAKPLLQLCSLLGREFDYELLKAVSQTENERALQAELHTMVNAEFLFQDGSVPDCTYAFKHQLMQETAYQTLLKSTRTQLHAQVADILEQQFPERAERNPELLAFHCEESAQPAKAVDYWTTACRRALESYALLEAIGLAENGLRATRSLPESRERDAAEIGLTSMLGRALLATRGYADPQVEQTFGRALALCESIGDAPQLFQLVVGLWMYFQIGGEFEHALTLAERLVRIAQSQTSAAKKLQAHYCHGFTLYMRGNLPESCREFEEALLAEREEDEFAAESASGDDTRIHLRSLFAQALWHVGQVERSARLNDEALELAGELGNPFGLAWANFHSSWLYVLREQPEEAAKYSEQTIEIAADKGFRFYQVVGAFMNAWASCDGGRSAQGEAASSRIESMEIAVRQYENIGARNGATFLLLTLAEALIADGRLPQAEARLMEFRENIASRGERVFEPELLRLEGQLARAGGDSARAEEYLGSAVASARAAGSIGLAQRAVANLAALYSETGDPEAAQALLAQAEEELSEQGELRPEAM